ncbi:MAG: glycosyltransferase family 2 protein, partial [Thermodesulfobacteriota bacterium]|nr:glycosyltransferase family 2 protein [Thermodesulfobacteriota bacterium]
MNQLHNSVNLLSRPKTGSRQKDTIMPKISLITPSFNQDKYLEECIDSILSQNYPNLEYIIMDGGSTDRSVDIIKKYERYLTYWQSRPDKGQYWAINEGFKKSTGEVMCWLNSDDKYHPLALFNVASLFTELPHIQWITGQPTVLGKHGDIISIVPLPKWSRRRYLFYDHDSLHIQQESTFWRRSLWEKAGAYLDVSLNYA